MKRLLSFPPVFMKRSEVILLGIAIALGVLLRMVDITFPDVLTDEAQFGLGASAAHPPLGMFLMKIMMMLFGANLIGLRSLSVILGIGCVALIYLIARERSPRHIALYAAAIASLFPGAILFSRLAFLTTPQLFFWLLTILVFLRVSKHPSEWMFIALFATCIAATFMKFQGFLVPSLLLLGRIVETRKHFWRDEIVWILAMSLVPIALYDVTHPGVAASVLLYGGADDAPGLLERMMLILSTWWSVLSIAIVLLPLSLLAIRKISWELWMMLMVVVLQGFLFGPTHEYYVADLAVYAIPAALVIALFPSWVRMGSVAALSVLAIALLGPRSLTLSPLTESLYQTPGYWNTHTDIINNALHGTQQIIVLGDAGHQLRWYLQPKVLVGKDMDLSHATGAFLLLEPSLRPTLKGGREIYNDEQMSIIVR